MYNSSTFFFIYKKIPTLYYNSTEIYRNRVNCLWNICAPLYRKVVHFVLWKTKRTKLKERKRYVIYQSHKRHITLFARLPCIQLLLTRVSLSSSFLSIFVVCSWSNLTTAAITLASTIVSLPIMYSNRIFLRYSISVESSNVSCRSFTSFLSSAISRLWDVKVCCRVWMEPVLVCIAAIATRDVLSNSCTKF